MRGIARRVWRLETRLVPQPNFGSWQAAVILYERRRQRYEREGRPFLEPALDLTQPAGPVHYLSAAETLRLRRELRLQQVADTSKDSCR